MLLMAALVTAVLSTAVRAQADEPNYVFVMFETTVTRVGVETSDANPEERRFYVSNVVGFPADDPGQLRRASKIADDYFTHMVVEPLKAKGIAHQYYDDGISINDRVVYVLYTRQEVEDLRIKTLAGLKEQNANVYTFNWAFGKEASGPEGPALQLFYHAPTMISYGLAASAVTKPGPKAEVPAIKKPVRKH